MESSSAKTEGAARALLKREARGLRRHVLPPVFYGAAVTLAAEPPQFGWPSVTSTTYFAAFAGIAAAPAPE